MNAVTLAIAARRLRDAITSEISRLRSEADRFSDTAHRVAGLDPARGQADPGEYARTCTVVADVLESILRKTGGQP